MSALPKVIQFPMTQPGHFDQFWAAYPHKVAKLAAKRAWLKMASQMPEHDVVMAGLERYKANKPEHQDWCHPATWINGGRWDDEYAAPVAPKPSPSITAMLNKDALARVESRIQTLKGQFPLQNDKQKKEWNDLKLERERLKKELGFIA